MMRAILSAASLTVLAILAFTDSSQHLFSPTVVSAPPQPYAVAPAAPVQREFLTVYGNPQEVPQFVQPVVHVQTSARAQHPTMIASGRRTPAPEVEGPPELLQEAQQLFILVLRLGTCALMVHHGFDKIQNVDGFSANVVAKFFGFLPGPPQFWTLSAAATQIAGAGLLGLGVLSRPVAASMMTTMIVAVIFHLLNTGGEAFPLGVPKAHSYNFELAAMYVLVLGYFTVSGAGKYSVDEQILGGEIKIYQGLFNKVFGGA
jgi:uncharacterized membrane protein YphA (DoxX/SURF4 family)